MKSFDIKRLTPIIYVFSVVVLLIITFKLLIFFLPFVIALAITQMLKKIMTKNRIVNNFILLSFYFIILALMFFIIFRVGFELINTFNSLIENTNDIILTLNNYINSLFGYFSISSDYIVKLITENLGRIINTGANSLKNILVSSLSLFKMIPLSIIFTMMTIVSSFIFLSDMDNIKDFFEKQFPSSWIKISKTIKTDVIDLVFNYLKTQSILITLCFAELIIGLSIISLYDSSIEYILSTALIIAIVDALPILGAGTVLIPWLLIELTLGNYILSASLLVLHLTIFVIRQYTEPKLISSGINIHPLVSLLSLYGGFKLFGVLGFLYGPIIVSIFKIVFAEEIKYGFFKYLINEGKENEENS